MREARKYEVKDHMQSEGMPEKVRAYVAWALQVSATDIECGYHYDEEGVARLYVRSSFLLTDVPKTISLRLSDGANVIAGLDYHGLMRHEPEMGRGWEQETGVEV